MSTRTLRVALLGCGVVGTEVVRLLTEHAADLTERVGARPEIVGVAVRRAGRRRDVPVDPGLFTTDAEALVRRGDIDELMAFRERAPGMPYAHPTVEHFAPIFVTLGAAAKPDREPRTAIDGFWFGLAKRSFEAR